MSGLSELFKMTAAERIQLAEDLWDSVIADPADLPPVSDVVKAELERRLAEHDQSPDAAESWKEVRARLWSRIG